MRAPAHVLVVEDEVLIRMLAVDLLGDLGLTCDEAGTAAEALDRLDGQHPYGLVLLDIGLPDMRGDELIREIRQRHATLPLLVASGEDPAALRKRLDTFAPIGFLDKPYDLERMRRALTALAR